MRRFLRIMILASLVVIAAGCGGSGKDTGITGTVNYNGAGLKEASIEIYLKKGKDKSVPPFMTGETDLGGNFTIKLPAGKYFVIGKKRFIEGGVTRMLMGDYPKNPVDVAPGESVTLSPFSLFNMGDDKRLDMADSGITGSVTAEKGVDLTGSFLYVYPESNPNMIGPDYVVSEELEADGSFKVNLLPGSYYVAVRQRSSKTKLGYLNIGDLSVDYDKNPAIVVQNEYLEVGELKLHTVDEVRLKKIKQDEAELIYSTKITGLVTDEDEEPVRGVYVYAYKDPKMVGKPAAISKKTDKNGMFTLYVTNEKNSDSNKYYIGARTNFGGPLEPGEYVGTYNENPEHSLVIGQEKEIDDIDISVKEVW